MYHIFYQFFIRDINHGYMVMSVLGNPNSPVRIYYNIWLVLLGILLTISSGIIASSYWEVPVPLSITTGILIILFAIGAGALSGVFSVNETKAVETFAILSFKNKSSLLGTVTFL